jgi:hypothetical protein
VGARFACGVVDDGGRVSNPDKPFLSSPADASRCRAAVKPNRNPDGVSPSQLDWQIWLVGDRPTYLVLAGDLAV